MNQENKSNFEFVDESINLREEIEKYIFHWKWFVLGVVFALVGAYLYLRYTPNQYEVATTILIDDKDNGGIASELSAFEDLGLMGNTKNSIDNEIELLKSRSLMGRVVKELEYNVSFYRQGRVINSEMLKEYAPIHLNFFKKDSAFYAVDTTFTIHVLGKNEFNLINAAGTAVKKEAFGKRITTKMGAIILTPSEADKLKIGDELIVKITPVKRVIDHYLSVIKIQPVNKKASVIKLSLSDVLKRKAENLLNQLVAQYNKD